MNTVSGTTAQIEQPVFTANRNRDRKPKTTKVPELPAFKTQPINQAFEQAKTTIENQKNLFGDLLTEGDLTILFGRSNVGKSFLSYQIGEAISRGKNVLNMIDVVSLKNHGETKYYNLNCICRII